MLHHHEEARFILQEIYPLLCDPTELSKMSYKNGIYSILGPAEGNTRRNQNVLAPLIWLAYVGTLLNYRFSLHAGMKAEGPMVLI